jgi:hypothetical protein
MMVYATALRHIADGRVAQLYVRTFPFEKKLWIQANKDVRTVYAVNRDICSKEIQKPHSLAFSFLRRLQRYKIL